MRAGIALGLALMAAAVAGCKADPARELLERELRLQEDRIYELEAKMADCDAQLSSTRRENSALRRDPAGLNAAGPALTVPPGIANPAGRARLGDAPPAAMPLVPPTVDPGIPAPPEDAGPLELGEPDARSGPGKKPIPLDDADVTQIAINRKLTGGYNPHGNGIAGVSVVFEPRDAQGQVIRVLGDVSIVVLDPAKEGSAQRVARWDFTGEEALAHFRKSRFGNGFHLDLPWPNDPPSSPNLQLFVRFSPPDGRKLVAEHALNLTSNLASGNGWIKATPAARRTGESDAPLAAPALSPSLTGPTTTAPAAVHAAPPASTGAATANAPTSEELPEPDLEPAPTKSKPAEKSASSKPAAAKPAAKSDAKTEARVGPTTRRGRPTWSPNR